MASYMDKVSINTAMTDSTKLDLSCDHITTGGFFQFMPVYIREMVPGERLTMTSEVFSRLQPLNKPTFGRCNINVRGFFVPMRTVFQHWNEFIVDTEATIGQTTWSGTSSPSTTLMPSVPYFYDYALGQVLLQQCDYHSINASMATYVGKYPWGSVTTSAHTTGDDFVFKYAVSGTDTLLYVALNYYGRQAVKILESLGYRIFTSFPGVDVITGSGSGRVKMSAMPLLALCKAYLDWYVNSQYYTQNSTYRLLVSFFNSTAVTNTSIVRPALAQILNAILFSNYDTDYFVSAWDNPNGPTNGLYSEMTFVDITNNASAAVQGVTNVNAAVQLPQPTTGYRPNNGTPHIASSAPASGSALVGVSTEYVMHALHSLTDYMKRHQLAGARVFDRYLARFGKALAPEKLSRSLYLGSHKTGVQFGDVMSTNGDNAKTFGDYSGKGIAYDKGKFEYTSDEYGYLILVSTIVPNVGYYQGIDRHVMHLANTDFWTPEFDNLGVQAISAAELYVSEDGSRNLGDASQMWPKVFGFAPRYAEYKVAKDHLTGDFARVTTGGGVKSQLDTWHMMREFEDNDFNNSYANVSHSFQFTEGDTDGDQFNRIFRDWNTASLQSMTDMFWLIYHFDIADYAPMKSLYDTYEFEDKGRAVTEEVNGVKMN